MLEKEVENQILNYLQVKGFYFWQVKVQGTYDAKKKTYRMPKSKWRRNGVSDIIGFYNGYFVALEVKAPARKNNVSDAQKEFLNQAIKNGQIGRVVWSLEQVIQTIEVLDDLTNPMVELSFPGDGI